MQLVSKRLLVLAIFSIHFILSPEVNARAETNQTHSKPILLKVEDIKFQQAPGFPKGAEISLLRGDLSQKVPYTLRFKIPDGFIIPSHWHSTDEEVTILSGILNVGMGDKVDQSGATTLQEGSFQVVPANAHHYLWSTGSTIFQVDGMGPRTTTFVNPAEWTALIQKSNNK